MFERALGEAVSFLKALEGRLQRPEGRGILGRSRSVFCKENRGSEAIEETFR